MFFSKPKDMSNPCNHATGYQCLTFWWPLPPAGPSTPSPVDGRSRSRWGAARLPWPCFWRTPREPPPPSSPATAPQRQQPQVKPSPARLPQPPGAAPSTWARSSRCLPPAMAQRRCHVRAPRLRARRFPGRARAALSAPAHGSGRAHGLRARAALPQRGQGLSGLGQSSGARQFIPLRHQPEVKSGCWGL